VAADAVLIERPKWTID